jgi:hypothetical protein
MTDYILTFLFGTGEYTQAIGLGLALGAKAALDIGGALLRRRNARRNRPQLFGETPSGRFLTGISRTGSISPEEQSNILAQVGTQAGNVAFSRAAGIRGELAAAGAGESIAGISAIAAPGRQAQEALTTTQRQLAIENARSKFEASRLLAAGRTERQEQRRQFEFQANQDFISSLTGAAGDAIGGFAELSELNRTEVINRAEQLISLGRIDEANELINKFLGIQAPTLSQAQQRALSGVNVGSFRGGF